jgi:hypothetical protein
MSVFSFAKLGIYEATYQEIGGYSKTITCFELSKIGLSVVVQPSGNIGWVVLTAVASRLEDVSAG